MWCTYPFSSNHLLPQTIQKPFNSSVHLLVLQKFYTCIPSHFPHSFMLQFYFLLTSLSSNHLLLLAFSTFLSKCQALACGWPVKHMVHLAEKNGCFSPESAPGVGHSKETVSRFGLRCILILKCGCFGVSCADRRLLLWRNEILPWHSSRTDGSLRSRRAGFFGSVQQPELSGATGQKLGASGTVGACCRCLIGMEQAWPFVVG